jgi:hypothetical protein
MSKAERIGIETYFDLDDKKKEANVNLLYDNPNEIFDIHFLSKKPIINDDFLNEIFYALRVLPSKYYVNVKIYFKDMNGYSEKELEDIFVKSIMITNAEWRIEEKKSNKVGLFFSIIGIVFLIILWVLTAILEAKFSDISSMLAYRVFYYVLDILITVILWEAVTIYFVKRNEDRAKHLSFNRRLNVVTFKKYEKE